MKDGGHNGSYYDLPPNCSRLHDVIMEKGMSYSRGNIFKAAYRWEEKGISDDPRENLIYNLEKIRWFAEDMLLRLYGQDEGNPRNERATENDS